MPQAGVLPPVAPHLKNALSRLGLAPRFARRFFFAERRIRGRSALMRHVECSVRQIRLKGKPCVRTTACAALDPNLSNGWRQNGPAARERGAGPNGRGASSEVFRRAGERCHPSSLPTVRVTRSPANQVRPYSMGCSSLSTLIPVVRRIGAPSGMRKCRAWVAVAWRAVMRVSRRV